MNHGSPVRIQRKRTRGFNLQNASPNGLPVVYVGRPTKWGNPFDNKWMFNHWLKSGSTLCTDSRKNLILGSLEELRGKNLACWCKEGDSCHADVLLELANE